MNGMSFRDHHAVRATLIITLPKIIRAFLTDFMVYIGIRRLWDMNAKKNSFVEECNVVTTNID